jgi:hypothetical protein
MRPLDCISKVFLTLRRTVTKYRYPNADTGTKQQVTDDASENKHDVPLGLTATGYFTLIHITHNLS